MLTLLTLRFFVGGETWNFMVSGTIGFASRYYITAAWIWSRTACFSLGPKTLSDQVFRTVLSVRRTGQVLLGTLRDRSEENTEPAPHRWPG